MRTKPSEMFYKSVYIVHYASENEPLRRHNSPGAGSFSLVLDDLSSICDISRRF